jgi:beta-glucosidase
VENRVEDLLARLTLEDKAGLMFHDIIAMLPGGQLMGADNPFGRPATEAAIREIRLNHFNLAGGVDNVRDLVAWHNRMQELALATGPGIPVTVSTDPRHSFSNNPGTEALAGAFPNGPSRSGSRPSETLTSSSATPTSPAGSTSPPASGWRYTRRSTWPPNHAGPGSG